MKKLKDLKYKLAVHSRLHTMLGSFRLLSVAICLKICEWKALSTNEEVITAVLFCIRV